MKKILLVLPSLEKGGLERQTINIMYGYDKNKYDLTVALFRNFIEYDVPDSIKIIDLNKRKILDINFIKNFYKLIRDGNFDVINSKCAGVNEYLILMCGLLNFKNLIVEFRSFNQFINYMKIWILCFFMGKKLLFVANSIRTLNQIKRYFGSGTFKFIGNGIDTDKFKKKKEKNDDNVFKIGFIGRISPEKNLETLIKAISHIKKNGNDISNFKIYLVGGHRDENYYNSLVDFIVKFGLTTNFVFVQMNCIPEQYYNILDLFILPSFFEGTPNVLLEAMACENVCLISKSANSDLFLNNEYNFETTNYIELASKIMMVKQMSISNRRFVGINNRNFVIGNYSIQSLIRKYEDTWESICAE